MKSGKSWLEACSSQQREDGCVEDLRGLQKG
jgi:hypothetical protein